MIEASKKLAPWRTAVAAGALTARQGMRGAPLRTPLVIFATFWFPRPKRPARPYPTADLDKLLRALLDGLVAGTLLHDDSWIMDITASKHWCDATHQPGCTVSIVDLR